MLKMSEFSIQQENYLPPGVSLVNDTPSDVTRCVIEPIPVWREIGMGYSHMSGEATNMGIENSSWVTNGTFPIPQEWLSRRDEIKIPHERRSREWGIFILSQLLSHEWGIGNVPWVTNEEFYSSLFLSRPGFTFPYGKENSHFLMKAPF